MLTFSSHKYALERDDVKHAEYIDQFLSIPLRLLLQQKFVFSAQDLWWKLWWYFKNGINWLEQNRGKISSLLSVPLPLDRHLIYN